MIDENLITHYLVPILFIPKVEEKLITKCLELIILVTQPPHNAELKQKL